MHHRVVPQAAGHIRRIMIIHALDQNLHHTAQIAAAALLRNLLHFLQQAVKAGLRHLDRHLILHGGCRRAGSLRIDKSERAVIANLTHHIHGLLKVLLRLTGEAHDNIRRQRNIRNRLLNLLRQRQILFLIVMAVHLL